MMISNEKGYLLVEVMIAITILSIGFLGILGLISSSISLNRAVSDRFIANYLSMEGIEIVKNLIDANVMQNKPWNEKFSNGNFEVDYKSAFLENNSSRRILFNSTIGSYGYSGERQTSFVRTINIALMGADQIKVKSTVKWSSRGGKFEISLEDYFFNWRP